MKVLSLALDMQSKQIDNVLDPTTAQDAATKNYVDVRVPASFNANTWFGNDTGLAAAPAAKALAALTEVDDANVTITLGGTPATALAKAVSITLGWIGTLALARGGLGLDASSVAANTFFGKGAGAGAPSFIQPNFTMLAGFATAAQAGLPTGGTVGQSLIKQSSTNYDAGWKTPGFVQGAQLASTAGTVSTTGVMAAIPGSITPSTTGRVLVIVSGYMTSSIAGQFAAVLGIRFGTGSAPAHGAAPTGTAAVGGNAYGHSAAANGAVPFSISSIITGLTPGTIYWLDIWYGSSSATSSAKLNTVAISAIEF